MGNSFSGLRWVAAYREVGGRLVSRAESFELFGGSAQTTRQDGGRFLAFWIKFIPG